MGCNSVRPKLNNLERHLANMRQMAIGSEKLKATVMQKAKRSENRRERQMVIGSEKVKATTTARARARARARAKETMMLKDFGTPKGFGSGRRKGK